MRRRLLKALWDCFSWLCAIVFVAGARYGFDLDLMHWGAIATYLGAACLLQLAVGLLLMLYRGRYRTASFDESIGLALCTLLVGAILTSSFLTIGPAAFPPAMAIVAPPIALLAMAAGRWCWRMWYQHARAGATGGNRTLIYGAGDAGHQLIQLIHTNDEPSFHVVGLIDDSPTKRHLRLLGVPVLGRKENLAQLIEQYEIGTVILAITSASSRLVEETSATVEQAGATFMVLPPVSRLLDGRVRLSDIREVDISDVLGRHQIQTDLSAIADYLNGRTVLVTGAGGSIGAELARQLHRLGPSKLILLDRDESALHSVQLSIYGQGLLDTDDIVLASIRDSDALEAAFAKHRPDVVFHAAALKHLPLLEQYPDEGWKTNVLGTLNVLEAANRYHCAKFVNISTDKAATPSSVLGRTKRLAEQLTAWYGARAMGTYLSVRFGNVLGSRGSMLHTFTTQIAAGGPVTVTHPDVTRYFMTIPEACELVIQAGAIGSDGEVLVLDMGEPVRILDVAQRLIAQARADVKIVFTGLRSGEKMHEILFNESEHGEKRHHPMISHVAVPPLDPGDLPALPGREHHRESAHIT
ncbi:polysaccharide biosynthesis protein [Ruania halotolerans]|uniref:polysaccharide biosynthesis protein n=1 Tax=Ruania halotolerans TaxID=2897773 RepID=UPI001E3B4561|nr:nucleoside-diphosphate sugar epimerase/dehydratase [Ruania halotolerans]UFU07267.1 polysaccharide biosynthesis protein [Ruania halotolerans]